MKVYERVHKLKYRGGWTIRVWCKMESVDSLRAPEQYSQYQTLLAHVTDVERHTMEVAETIAQLPFCNAVEITDGEGNGVIIYPDWP